MCGIGVLYSAGGALDPRVIAAVQEAVRHRGPDDEGVVCFDGAGSAPSMRGGRDTPEVVYAASLPYTPARGPLAAGSRLALIHRRLSILDLSASGHQPMCTADRGCWIVYNGEIYNYVELRDELKALGHAFVSQSDTEVILAAYRAWGRACLGRLNGMFAFVLYDRARNRLFAARDRFGVKPLYYWVSPGGMVALASEIKQFSVLPGWRPRVNGQRAYDFLNWGVQDHTDETLFEGVYQLRGGEALELDLGAGAPPPPGARLPAWRWYELRSGSFRGSLSDAGEAFRQLLTDSVRLRLRSDVPVGSCLSGGLDSSSIVCVMNALLRERGGRALQETFSACSSVERFDERGYIDEVVRHTGTDAHYVYPPLDGLFESLDRIAWHQDEPFGSTGIYAQWCVFRLAAGRRIRVLLDGQGADELLGGYHTFFAPRFRSLLLGLRWRTLHRELAAARRLHGYRGGWGYAQTLGGLLPGPLRRPMRRLAGADGAATALIDLDRLGADPVDPFMESGASRAASVRALSHAQLAATSLPKLLHFEDRDSMAHSVEARLPFLDYRLVELALGLPDEYKVAGGETKRVLRAGMRGVLPERVRARVDKLGFATPEELWLRENPGPFRAALAGAMDAACGVLTPRAPELLERMAAGQAPYGPLVWRCISFGTWLKVHGARI